MMDDEQGSFRRNRASEIYGPDATCSDADVPENMEYDVDRARMPLQKKAKSGCYLS